MTDAQRAAEREIRAARARSNAAIARRDPDASVAEMAPDALVIASSGALVPNRAAMRDAFAHAFAETGFISFVRTPERLEISANAETAAEEGRWRSLWEPAAAGRERSGPYLARWTCRDGRWAIQSEVFIPV
ncbi:nuclear transport factor 2 family protein [Sphingosinicella soli]|uniref:Ketosteroid isomerase-like protein n=1 Tax=Sphingosinicella soli TaxID=333708 RepID=A0A7W7F9S5_9SPHN|nr:nuclear transport factor 2 family protein [Sphingosinicella soli]MBB4632948.1 ketosteroid isomerase-like protein [Sphingosinicella soli]